MGNNGDREWKYKMTEWRGYVKATLETLMGEITGTKESVVKLEEHVNHRNSVTEKRLTKLEKNNAKTKTEYGMYKKFGLVVLGIIINLITLYLGQILI